MAICSECGNEIDPNEETYVDAFGCVYHRSCYEDWAAYREACARGARS